MPTQHIALALFLVLLAIGVIILISILIIVKRRIARRKSRIGRTAYHPCGYGLPKVWKSNIEKKINATIKIRTEPQVFGAHYAENDNVYTASGEVTFLYRAKTVDQFLILKQAILSLDPTLEAPPLRDIRDFLLTARHHLMYPPPCRDYIEEYCQLYLWARHDLNPFGELEYKRFCELQTNLLEVVNRTSSWPVYSSSGSATNPTISHHTTFSPEQSSSSLSKLHKRTQLNFKMKFPSFLFKATQEQHTQQPRTVHKTVLATPTTTNTTTIPTSASSSLTTHIPLSTITSSAATVTATVTTASTFPIHHQSRVVKVLSKKTSRQNHSLHLKRFSSSSSASSPAAASASSHLTHRKKHEFSMECEALTNTDKHHHDTTAITDTVHATTTTHHLLLTNGDAMIDNHDDDHQIDTMKTMPTLTTIGHHQQHHQHRRDSCDSDGSQTALIHLDEQPPIMNSVVRNYPLKNDAYIMIMPPTDMKQSIRFNKGMENEGVNC
ncbi:unnamed protein product [Schistosoma turkestanicum]|nr:unnamed protein product [Schistosoma turkestanicum]